MKAMLWKDLRENFKWAVIAMVGLGLAEIYGLLQPSNYGDQSATLCKDSFLMSTSFGCAAVGIILGLMQIVPEKRRDQWASVLHRPVSRATTLQGKVVAGLILYLLATVIPFLASVWYVALPGHFASPFLPAMTLPGFVDILAGTMFYFAALFAGLHHGRWFGPRSFGFPAAMVDFAFSNTPYFSVAVIGTIFLSTILFTAAWGAILTNGRLSDQPWLGRLSLVTVVVTGVFFLGIMLLLVLGLFSPPDYVNDFTHYEIDLDGRPLKIVSDRNAGTTVTDLAGNIIQDKRFTTGSRYDYILGFTPISAYIGDPHQLKEDNVDYESFRNNHSYVVPATGTYDSGNEVWYYLPQTRQFVGYFYKTKQRIGSIGLNGFRPGYENAEPFADLRSDDSQQVPAFVQFGSTVYHNDFDQRKLTPIFTQPGTEIFGVGYVQSNQDRTIELNWCAVALSDKMEIIDKSGQIIAVLPYHQNMDRLGTIYVGVKPGKDRFFLYYQPSGWIDGREKAKMPSYVEEMDANGRLQNTYTLPPVPEPSFPKSWQEYVLTSLPPPVVLFGVIAYDKIGALGGSEHLAKELVRDWDDLKEVLGRATAISFALSLLTLSWARRIHFSWRRAWAWTVFVFAFNLAGLITFRLVADWPVQIPCPKCGRKRPVDVEACPHCRSGWPLPIPRGIEIFDGQAPSAVASAAK